MCRNQESSRSATWIEDIAIIWCDRLDRKFAKESRCKAWWGVVDTKLLAIIVVDERLFVDLGEDCRVEALVVNAGAELLHQTAKGLPFARRRHGKPAEGR